MSCMCSHAQASTHTHPLDIRNDTSLWCQSPSSPLPTQLNQITAVLQLRIRSSIFLPPSADFKETIKFRPEYVCLCNVRFHYALVSTGRLGTQHIQIYQMAIPRPSIVHELESIKVLELLGVLLVLIDTLTLYLALLLHQSRQRRSGTYAEHILQFLS